MSRKSSSGYGEVGYINDSQYGGSGYYSMVKSETGSSADFSGLYDDMGSETKQSSAKGDSDAMTVHRRKMMRRAANRRSAQLSRARKKVCSQSSFVLMVVVIITLAG